jgi:S1-C subfamily serine protease
MKRSILILGAFAVLAAAMAAFGVHGTVHADQPASWSDEELSAIVTPAVVRIAQVDTGTSTIPQFSINLNNFTFTVLANKKPYVVPSDATYLGSGFIVNPDGYILTNSHVISASTVKIDVAQQIIAAVTYEAALALTSQQAARLQNASGTATTEATALGKQLLNFILANGKFAITQKITVLDPSSTPDTIDNLIAEGFPATVVSVNDNYENDQRDIGLIKIGQTNLPALAIGSSQGLESGESIYTVGFPATAQISQTDYLESDFTQGVVSAIKDSDDGTFKIIQTDAKVSSGSSGSPVITQDGKVVGLVTFESGQTADASGDNFASALPVELAAADADNGKDYATGNYAADLENGLTLLHENHCKAAIADFKAAEGLNPSFSTANYVGDFITQCNALIASGQSIDSQWDVIKAYFHAMGWQVWGMAIAGILIVFLLIFIVVRLLKRSAKAEKEIANLETIIEERKEVAAEATPIAAAPPGAPSAAIPPDIVEYVAKARAAGVRDDDIRVALTEAGWPANDIAAALRAHS